MNFRRFFLAAILFLLGCDKAERPVDSKILVGEWALLRAANQNPSQLEIRNWLIVFQSNGTWAYSGELSGEFSGTGVQASGHWKMEGNTLEYTNGEITGKSKVFQINDTDIVLSPDPTIAAKGRRPVESVYRRVK